jgi:hypothetical protein
MYIHFKSGFVEADRWDGTPIPHPRMQEVVDKISHRGVKNVREAAVIVCRSRQRGTLIAVCLLAGCGSRPVFDSPADWDYEHRLFLTAEEWGRALTEAALGLDYRNFKSWTLQEAPEQNHLAHSIWEVAKDAKSVQLTEEQNRERTAESQRQATAHRKVRK